jgi:ferrous iron transport protein A
MDNVADMKGPDADERIDMIAAGFMPHGCSNAKMRTIPIWTHCVRLAELPCRVSGIVESVEDRGPNDGIARRLRELGFVAGEPVEVVATAPWGGDPMLVQVGFTRFALRRAEAVRVRLRGA